MALLEKFWTVIKPLRSSIAGRIPTAAAVGELAVNDADEILYLKKEDGSFVVWKNEKKYEVFNQDSQNPSDDDLYGEDVWIEIGKGNGIFHIEFDTGAPVFGSRQVDFCTLHTVGNGSSFLLYQSNKLGFVNFRSHSINSAPNHYHKIFLNVTKGYYYTRVKLTVKAGSFTPTIPRPLVDSATLALSNDAIVLGNAIN